VGNGTRFYVELPLQPPSSRPRVLLVSDDAKWLREVARTLKTACDVRAVPVAAAKLGNKRTDLVLVDPAGKSKKLESLRSEAKDAQVPVIELPSESAAATRLARTLAQFAP
jgi:DNA-binding response OmpR family regulator